MMASTQQLIRDTYPEINAAPVSYEMPLLWGNMDSAQHVNNLVYMSWTETSRIKLFREIGDISFDSTQGVILAWQDMKYIFPMTYPDTALITAGISEIKEDRFFILSKVYSLQHNKIVALSNQSIVPYDYLKFRKMPISEEWRIRLDKLTIS